MRLLLFFTFEMSLEKWSRAGLVRHGLKFYNELARNGIQVDLVTYAGREDYVYQPLLVPGVAVHPVFIAGPANLWLRFFLSWLLPFRLRSLIRKSDLVKTHQMWGSWQGLAAKLLYGKKWILRGGFEHHRALLSEKACLRDRLFSFILSWLGYRLADAVVWSNESDLRWSVDYFGLKEADPRFQVLPNYVDTGEFRPRPAVPENRNILAVARLDREKNLDSLLRALTGSDYHLELVGDGPLRTGLEQLAGELSVKVGFSGRLPHEELVRRMHEARVFVLCSWYEGLPSALLEAMACGMAVVGGDNRSGKRPAGRAGTGFDPARPGPPYA